MNDTSLWAAACNTMLGRGGGRPKGSLTVSAAARAAAPARQAIGHARPGERSRAASAGPADETAEGRAIRRWERKEDRADLVLLDQRLERRSRPEHASA